MSNLWIEENFESLESFFGEEKDYSATDLLNGAIASLQWFVIDNYLCFVDHEKNEKYQNNLKIIRRFLESSVVASYSLNVDGQRIPSIVRSQEFLRLSRFLIDFLNKNESAFFQSDTFRLNFLLWSIRSALIHHMALPMSSATILDEALGYVKQFDQLLLDDNNEEWKKFPQKKWKCIIELVQIMIGFGHLDSVKKYFEMAKKFSNIKYSFVGEMGIRTKFQEKPVAQLKVKLDQEFEIDETEPVTIIPVPVDVHSEDATLLPDIKYENEQLDIEPVKLKTLEQAMLLTVIRFHHRYQPSDDQIMEEEQLAYLKHFIKHSDCWNVKFCLLESRSLYERTKPKLVERAMKQFETLSDTVRKSMGSEDFVRIAQERLNNCFLALNSPFWVLDKHLADILCSLGVFKAALEVYLRIEQWNEVISCYRRIGLPEKAKQLVQEKLNEDDNRPDLHCLLGDITGDLRCYEYALKLSDNRYAPAFRMLGRHFFETKDWDEALKCYQDCVDLNPCQPDVWYRIGYINLARGNWDMAVRPYRMALLHGGDTAEGWNNLSKAYIKQGKKELALKTLQEAIKCAYDNWMIWDNYLAVAIDLGELSEAIRAWNKLIDLKGKYFDDMLARKLVSDVQDEHSFIPLCIKLFARIVATSPGSPIGWHLYARLSMMMAVRDLEEIERNFQKSLRLILTPGWEKDPDKTLAVLILYNDVIADLLNLSDLQSMTESIETRKKLFHSIRLACKNVIDLIEKNLPELPVPDQKKREQLQARKKFLNEAYESVIENLKDLDAL